MPDGNTIVAETAKQVNTKLLEEQDRKLRLLLNAGESELTGSAAKRSQLLGALTKPEQEKLATGLKGEAAKRAAALAKKQTEAEFKPAYEARLTMLTSAIATLTPMLPVTAKRIETLRAMRAKAGGFATANPPDWKEAAGALDKKVVAAIESEGRADYTQQRDQLADHSILGPVAKQGKLVVAAFEKARTNGEVGPGGSREVRAMLDEAYRVMLTAYALQDRKAAAKAAGLATSLFSQAENRTIAIASNAKAEKQNYENAVKRVTAAIADLRKRAPDLPELDETDFVDLERRRTDADDAAAFGDFTAANKRLADVAADCQRFLAKASTTRQAVTTEVETGKRDAAQAATTLSKLLDRVENDAMQHEPFKNASELKARLDKLAAENVDADDADVCGLRDNIKEALVNAEIMRVRLADVPSFNNQKGKLIQQVDDKFSETEALLDSLEKRLSENEKIDADVREERIFPLRAELASRKQNWEASKANGYDLLSLGNEGAAEGLKKLQEAIAAAGAPKAVAAMENQNSVEAARRTLQGKVTIAGPLVDMAVSLDPKKGLEFARVADLARSLIASSEDAGELARMDATLAKHIDAAEKAKANFVPYIAGLRKQVEDLSRDVITQLGDLRAAIAKKPTADTRRAAYDKMIGKLLDRNTVVAKLAAADDLAVLTGALADAGQIKADAERTVAGWDKPAESDPNSIDYVRSELAKVDDKFNKVGDRNYVMVSYAAISDQLDAVKKALGGDEPSEALKAVQKIDKAIDVMVAKAQQGETNYNEIKKLVAAITKKLTRKVFTTKFDELAPDFVTETNAKLKILDANGMFEDGFKQAKKDLEALDADLDAMLASPANLAGVPVRLADAQEKAKAEKDKKELQKQQYAGEAKALHSEMLYAQKNFPRAAGQIKNLQTEMEFVDEQMVKKNDDPVGGLRKIKAIRTALADLADFPNGQKVMARNNLPVVRQVYMKAVIKFAEQIDQLGATVKQFDLSNQAEGKTSAENASLIDLELTRLRALFSPFAFHGTVKKMVTMQPGDAAKSKVRERGLKQARRLLKRLQKDHRLRLLTKNPFLPELKKTVSRVNVSLLEMEHNLLVSD